MRNSNQKDKFLVRLTHKIALIEVISHDCHKFLDVILATRAWNIRGFFTQADKPPDFTGVPDRISAVSYFQEADFCNGPLRVS